jgi:hypothetical protein
MKGLEHWAAEPCELCGLKLGYEHSIRIGHGAMGYQHAVCAAKYATYMLRQIKLHPERAVELAQEALEMLGQEHEPDDKPLVYWPDEEDG